MSDYKSTLNLPTTDFPMKANLAQREPAILAKWQSLNLYHFLVKKNANKPLFVLHDGPPYANGHAHMGHALNKVLKDIVIKHKLLSGFNAPMVPGWDCHGLPIELNVEKKLGKPGHKISVSDFRKACREYADTQINLQRDEFIRLGSLGDWFNPYITMSYQYEANIIRSLAKIIANNHVKKGYRPVHWCLDCCSALAEAEVEYKDKVSTAIDVKFTLVDVKKLPIKEQLASPIVSIPIWTTTPWTLPANEGVALNAEVNYDLVSYQDGCLIIAKDLVESTLTRYRISDYKILHTFVGKELEGLLLQHPFLQKHVPVVLGQHVTTESGTGAVHTSPAHGQDDFEVGKQYGLPLVNPVNDDGCFNSAVDFLQGIHVTKANAIILEKLQINQTLLHQASLTHSYPHCWRHKTPLIFRATPQWFISMDQNLLRQKALEAIEKIQFTPEWGQGRLRGMIESRPDWCISRQRTWGVPIALFIHKETGEMHPNSVKLMEDVALKVEQGGVDVWYDLSEKELLGDDAIQYQKCLDILDVWFDSGSSHFCVLDNNPDLKSPADMYLEGSDQHRGWFQTSLLTSIAMKGVAPFKTLLTHGYVLDAEKRKMSKSLGNTLAPAKIIEKLGADVLRLWAASIDYRGEITVSEEILTRTSETYRRIRNTTRFLLANLAGFTPADCIPYNQLLDLDKWIISKAFDLQQELLQAYDNYQFHVFYQRVHHFCSIDLGSFYLDIIKDRQYTTKANSLARRSAQTAIYHILEAIVRWLAPVLTFTAEEIWSYLPGERLPSVLMTEWYQELQDLPSDSMMDKTYWEAIRQIRDAVNKEIEALRNDGKVGSALEANVTLYCDPINKALLDKLGEELRFVLITSTADVLSLDDASENLKEVLPGIKVLISATEDKKCERCWHRRKEVGTHSKHPSLCERCIDNIEGHGEKRRYA